MSNEGIGGKRSESELKRLVEVAVEDACGLPRSGIWFCVNHVEASGRTPDCIKAWATLHFLVEGSPFCCGEPQCHLWLFDERLEEIGEHVRRAIGLRSAVSVEFVNIAAQYAAGVAFSYGRLDAETAD